MLKNYRHTHPGQRMRELVGLNIVVTSKPSRKPGRAMSDTHAHKKIPLSVLVMKDEACWRILQADGLWRQVLRMAFEIGQQMGKGREEKRERSSLEKKASF